MFTKEKAKAWLAENQAYVLFGAVIAFYSLFINNDRMDDVTLYGGIRELCPLTTWLKFRWDTWTSRVLLDGVSVLMVEWNIWIFRILNWCMWMLLVRSMAKLLGIQKKVRLSYFLVLAFLIYPFKVIGSVGWCNVGVIYVWVSALGCFAVTSYTRFKGTDFNTYGKGRALLWIAAYFAATVFAANQEMACAILCAVFGMLFLAVFREKTVSRLSKTVIGSQFLLSAGELIVILTCQGNYIRKGLEAERWMPEYVNFGLADKLSIGVTDTINGLFVRESLLGLLFAVIVCMAVFAKTKRLPARCIALLPAVFMAAVRFIPDILENEWAYLSDSWQYMITPRQSDFIGMEPEHIVGLLMWAGVFLCLLAGVYLTCDTWRELLFYSIVLGSGFATRVVVGFSPSVYVSGSRTFYFFFLILIFCMVHILRRYEGKLAGAGLGTLQGGMGLLAVFSILNTLGGM